AHDVLSRLSVSSDLSQVVALLMEEHRYEQTFGRVFLQPVAAEQTRKVAGRALSPSRSWIWLAERRGRAVGLIWVSPPERSRWAKSLVRARPTAHIGHGVVTADERGSGIGTAVVGP